MLKSLSNFSLYAEQELKPENSDGPTVAEPPVAIEAEDDDFDDPEEDSP